MGANCSTAWPVPSGSRLNDVVALVSQLGAHRFLPIADHDIEIVGGDDLARVGEDIVQDRAVAQLLQHHRRVSLGRFFSAREDDGFQFKLRLLIPVFSCSHLSAILTYPGGGESQKFALRGFLVLPTRAKFRCWR